MRVTLSGGKIILYIVLLAAVAYGGYRLYRDVVVDYIENHPTSRESLFNNAE